MKFTHERMSAEFEKFHFDGFPFAATVHHFTEKDRGGFHDHPWGFRSTILKGSYTEEVLVPSQYGRDFWIDRVTHQEGDSFLVKADHIHQIVDLPQGECWTLIQAEPWSRDTHWWKVEDGILYSRQWDKHEWIPYVPPR